MPVSVVCATMVLGAPLTSSEWSPSFANVAPLAAVKETGLSTVQLAVTSPPVSKPSAKVLRSSVVKDSRSRPSWLIRQRCALIECERQATSTGDAVTVIATRFCDGPPSD